MRVLFLNRYSLAMTTGGMAEYLHYLPMALRSHGVDVLFYHEGETSALTGPEYAQNDVPVYYGPFVRPSFFVFTQKLKPLVELVYAEHIDLVHAQGAYRSGYVAMQLSKKTKIPFVVTSHADIVATNSDRMKREKVQRRCRDVLRHATFVTHLSPLMEGVSHQLHDTHEKSVIIGNGIDLSGWSSFVSLPEQNYLLGMGRLEPEKGFDILIDVYAKLRERGIKTSLVIAGSGSAELALQNQVKQHGLNLVTHCQDLSRIPDESVVFTGYVRGDAKKQLVAQSQLILFPTQPHRVEEAFGIVQIEAMAAGKVVVASDSATTRYLQSLGLQAVLVKADDVAAWALQIQQLLSDDSLRKQLGQTNIENVRQFDWDVIAKQYQEVYLSCLAIR